MLINANDRFERRHEMLQTGVRFATGLAGAQTELLAAHVNDADTRDPDGPLVMRAVCLFAYALQKFGVVAHPEHASLVVRLAQLARCKNCEEPEIMAVRWILGRVRLAEAAVKDLSPSLQHVFTDRALNCFNHIREVELNHPVLLPGILVEYPNEFFVDRHPLDADPPVRRIHPPYRYQMATAAALIRLDPKRTQHHGDNIEQIAITLIRTHPEAPLAHLNGELSVAAATALGCKSSLTAYDREIGHRLIDRIHASVRDHGLSTRKSREWLAASHAVNALLADSEHEAREETARMVAQLKILFANSYRTSLPDFMRVDAVYRRAFDRMCGQDLFDYGEFLRRLMPGV